VPSQLGVGSEFVGHRPYAPGDDLRALDWDLLARSSRPWVRVARREAGERWLVRLDASASMGVGPPGKLQRAAEVAAGIAVWGSRSGAAVCVSVAGGEGGPREFRVRRRSEIAGLLAFLGRLRAGGGSGALPPARALAHVSRVFVVGDLRDLRPELVLPLRGRGRSLSLIQILAPLEVAPAPGGSVEWWDPERGGRVSLALDPASVAAYERELGREVEAWREIAARHGVPFGCFLSDRTFEEILERSRPA
jgi:uncharacterized protein (DUF58 family)